MKYSVSSRIGHRLLLLHFLAVSRAFSPLTHPARQNSLSSPAIIPLLPRPSSLLLASIQEEDQETSLQTNNVNTTATNAATSDLDDDDATNPFQLRSASTYCVHGVTNRDGPLNQVVANIVNSTLDQANDLIEIGAVWARMEGLTEQDLLDQYNDYDDDDYMGSVSSSSRALYADIDSFGDTTMDLEEYTEKMAQQRFRRVLTPSWIQAGTDLRIYPRPRRFPSAQNLTSLLYQDTTFVVVDKPPMLPTQPDASNYYECCPGAVEQNLGPFPDITGRVRRPLLCHRVDACVGGCVVLSKDRNGQKVFADFQRQRQLRKVYRAVTTQPVPVGIHLHWMWAPQSARGKSGGPPCQLIRHSPPESRRKARNFWNRCVLEVVACEPISVPQSNAAGYRVDPAQQYYQSTIRLVTGRKHQVRAQLASLGCPIIGDTLYEPLAGRTLDELEDQEEELDDAIAKCRAPTRPIGLQAHGILFGGIRVKAGPAWWNK